MFEEIDRRFSNISNFRKGVTPVIAVLLLLMMTVAAAGGAYVWMNSLQGQLRDQTQEEVEGFDRSISMSDLRCSNEGENGKIEVLLRNSGDKEIDLDPMDIEVRDADTDDIDTELSVFDADLSGEDGGDSDVAGLDGDSISSPGNTGVYTIDLGGSFNSDELYEVTLIFKDEDDYDISATCRAGS